MNEILTGLASLVMAPIVFLATFFASPLPPPPAAEPLGVALPSGTALFETSLAAPITNTAVTLTLVSNTVRGGGSLSGYQCFTLSEGTAQTEYVCGTVTGTTVTGLERGLSPSDGVTSIASLQFSHRRGASVKITDFPLIQRLRSQASGSGTYEAVLQYAPGVTPTGGSDIVDVEYVTSVITGTSTLSYNRIVVQGTAGETLATGTIVFLRASDSRWYRADNDLPETYVDQTLGIAQGPGTAGAAIFGGVLTYGLDSTQRALTPGGFVFLSATAGATSTATTSQVLGKAISATTMFFDQNLVDSSVYTSRTFLSPTTFNATTTFIATTTGSGLTFVYTSTTTQHQWTKPFGAKLIEVCLWGAGGGGGGSGITNGGSSAGGGGGSAGGLSCATLNGNSVTTTVGVTVGVGGAAGTGRSAGSGGAGVSGSPGQPSLFGTYLSAEGGFGGTASTGATPGGGASGGNGLTSNGGSSGAGGAPGAFGVGGTAVTTLSSTGGGGGAGSGAGGETGGNAGTRTLSPSFATVAGGSNGLPGSNGTTSILASEGGGTGGGGGGGLNTPGTGGRGGNGILGGGGGGGGGTNNTGTGTTNPGADGGRGGDGVVVIRVW